MSLQDHVNKDLIAQGIFKAAIIGLDGKELAKSANFKPLPAELQAIAKNFSDQKYFQTNGVTLEKGKYLFLSADDSTVRGKKGKDGVFCVKTSKSIVIAIHDGKMTPPQAASVVGKMTDQLTKKGLNLRIDMLSQILTRVNVRSGGRFLVFENSCQGLVTAAVLERVGHIGGVYQVHGGTTPPTQCIDYLNFPEEMRRNLKFISIGHLRKLMNAGDDANGEEKPVDIPAAQEMVDSGTDATPGKGEGGKRRMEEEQDSGEPKKQKLSSKAWDEASKAWSEIKETPLDGLVVVTRQPEPLLMPLLRLLAPSRCFAVFSPHLEPLSSCYTAVKSSGIGLNLKLSETWLRNYQVLTDRTHPEINMSGGGGYILSGTTCLKS